MGIVYEAVQEHPKRTVALKIVSAGLASPELLRRFEHESQILARLDHPGIAYVFEAGTFDVGHGPQPFFAMEFIKGVPLVEYATAKKLSTRERLGLLAKVADAVQHAHQKGIIHRDLKPANILVTEVGEPKILDFGVARATDSDIQATTLQTDIGQLIGTVPYMSPEQAAGDPSKLDTRSDVYAIGVIAYELLAGQLPYDVEKKMIHEAVRVIREDDPAPLSSIDRIFRGDIEIIIAKALEKERERRYQTVGDFATDIRRYLSDEPIDARPPSTWYQVSKFAKRNRVLVGAVVAILVVLFAGVVGTSIGLVRAIEARESEARQKIRAEMERAEAAKQAGIAHAVVRFLGEDLLGSRVPESRRSDVSLRQLLDAASARLASKFKDSPEIEAYILTTIGTAYFTIGDLEHAETHLTQACALRTATLGKNHLETMKSMNNLGLVYQASRRHSEAEAVFVDLLAARRRTLGREHPDTLVSLNNLANLYRQSGRYGEAEALCDEALATQDAAQQGDDLVALAAAVNLAGIYAATNRLTSSESLYRSTLERFRLTVGQEHPKALSCLHGLAQVLQQRRKFDEAESSFKRTLEVQQNIIGMNHPATLATQASLGMLYLNMRRYGEAEKILTEVVAQRQGVLGKSHPDTLDTENALASVYQMVGRLDKAELLYIQILEGQREILGNEDRSTLGTLFNLTLVYCKQARYGKAESTALETLALHERLLGKEHPQTLAVLHCLGALYLDMKRFEDARTVAERTLALSSRKFGDEHPSTLGLMHNVAASYEGLGLHEQAKKTFTNVLDRQRRVLGISHPDSIESVIALAGVYEKLAEFTDAEELLLSAFSQIVASDDAGRDSKQELALALESLYDTWNQPGKKVEWHDQAAALDREISDSGGHHD